ncbi:hypothetical protein AB0C68_39120 [Streptomyces tendae]|uniref:hypothetical protein n=1 Tax=Streptomyces tendae TaxID=1932 RepID=UPI0033F8DAB6
MASNQTSHTGTARLVNRCHIPTVNSGLPHMIEYTDNCGFVRLRPAMFGQAGQDPDPEGEQYAPGDPVIVRPVVFHPGRRGPNVMPEYAGTVLNKAEGYYNVRACFPGVDGHSIRRCTVHELRSDTHLIGTAPWCCEDKDVTAALALLKSSGHTLAAFADHAGRTVDGAFVTRESGDDRAGSRVAFLAGGWSYELPVGRGNSKRRVRERIARNDALAAYTVTFSRAGWKVHLVESTGTTSHHMLHLLVWSPTSDET